MAGGAAAAGAPAAGAPAPAADGGAPFAALQHNWRKVASTDNLLVRGAAGGRPW
jgi:hypothetical protein